MLKKRVIKVCLGSSCYSRGNSMMISHVQKFIRVHALEDKVEFSGEHCRNECVQGPNIRINGKVFRQADIDSIDELLNKELGELL